MEMVLPAMDVHPSGHKDMMCFLKSNLKHHIKHSAYCIVNRSSVVVLHVLLLLLLYYCCCRFVCIYVYNL